MRSSPGGRVLLPACLAVLLLACSRAEGDQAPPAATAPPAPTATSASPATATPMAGPLTLRVVSYNVLWGGGFDDRFEQFYLPWQHPVFGGRNRLPAIIDMLEGIAPDLLVVQEAAGWSEGEDPVAAQIGRRLGMRHAMAQNEWALNAGLFSRYHIVEALDLSPFLGTNSAQVVILETPDGQPLVVANVHLDPSTSAMRRCQLELVLSVVEPLQEHRTLLLGDLNFRPGSREFEYLLASGWELLAIEPGWRVDHMWAREGVVESVEGLWGEDERPGYADGRPLSDHQPLGAAITFPELPTVEVALSLSQPASRCEPQAR